MKTPVFKNTKWIYKLQWDICNDDGQTGRDVQKIRGTHTAYQIVQEQEPEFGILVNTIEIMKTGNQIKIIQKIKQKIPQEEELGKGILEALHFLIQLWMK